VTTATPAITALFLLAVSAHAAASQWYTLTIDGERVGYVRQDTTRERDRHVYAEHLRIEATQFRRRSTIERNLRIERTLNGEPLRVSVAASAGVDKGGWQGTFSSDAAQMTIAASAARGPVVIQLPQRLQLPDDLAAGLQSLWSGAKTELRAPMFDLSRAGWSWVSAAIVPVPNGAGLTRIRVLKEAGEPADREDLWFDGTGRLLAREQQYYGSRLRWESCARDCEARIERPFDPIARSVVRSPYRIPHASMNGPIRYVISRTDGAKPRVVVTSEQAVAWDGQRAIVTICATCGVAENATAEELARFRAPNAWVQSADSRIRALARRGRDDASSATRMRRLVQLVRERMSGPVDYLGYSTAVEALEHRSGDCSEFAVLLAALARAEGLPARMVSGLAYSDRFSGKKDVFSQHAWVQVWDGRRWVSYDAALEGFDATHIAIAIGDGDPQQFVGTLGQLASWRIEKAGVIR
jgi:hypothetical protein